MGFVYFFKKRTVDTDHGYAVGDSGLIRRTDDGGAHWQLVIPEINAHGVPSFKSVWTTAAGNAILTGNGNFIGQATSNNTVTHTGTYSYLGTTGTQWNKIRFNSNHLDSGYIVGTGDSIKTALVNKTNGNFTLTHASLKDPVTSDLKSIHVYRDNSFMVVGTGNEIAYYYPPSTTWTDMSPTSGHYSSFTWNDVYFRDDRTGWIVGDSLDGSGHPVAGEILKTIIPVNIQSATPSQVVWNSEPVGDGLSARNIVSNPQQILYNCIAASGPYDLFVGGSYSGTPPSNTQGYCYARLLNDQGGQFSELRWYDKLGREIISQNTKLRNYKRPAYTYTLYDNLNRVIEIGQKTENTDTANNFNKIFGDTVMSFYNPNVINPNKFLTWIKDNTGPRTEVTHSYYDVQDILPTNILVQQNLRNRVASVTYADSLRVDSTKYNNATHYSYDIAQGDVATLIQDDSVIGISGQRFKKMDYQYDLINHNVNEIDFQSGSLDQYHERFDYDADNRLLTVQTSKDSIMWDNDATYFYYAHKPIARIEIGDQEVQGTDYVYTLQGWMKGVNSDLLAAATDMGHDGLLSSSNLNSNFAKDAAGFMMDYFTGDYDAINKTQWNNIATRFESVKYGSSLMKARHDNFNGNPTAMGTSISKPIHYSSDTSIHQITLPQGTAYNYDQLNRLVSEKAYQNLGASVYNTWGVMSYNGLYYDSLTYDANGNILTQQRNDSVGGVMSILKYQRNIEGGRTLQNRLYHVNNTASSPNPLDIKDEGVFDTTETTMNTKNNYRYDAIGELVKDSAEELDTIIWTNYHKIWKIRKYNGDSIIFTYGGVLHDRMMKEYKPASGTPKYTYYVYNGINQIWAIYSEQTISSALSYSLTERDIYGSNRIGTDNTPVQLISPPPVSQVDTFSRYLGLKNYEIDNHLGSVLALVSDRKIPRLNKHDSVYYEPDVVSANDYYPYGMLEPGRNFDSPKYRYGFDRKEKDDELKGNGNSLDFVSRIYDPRLGLFLSLDPAIEKYPFMSPYCFAADNPIRYSDMLGLGPEDRVKAAQAMVDKGYKYKQELTNELRTGSDAKDLEFMDCAEFVCRVMSADKITDGVQWMACGPLMTFFQDKSKFEEHTEPKAGDIGIWSEHTFIVKSYDPDTKDVTVLHATEYSYKLKNGTTVTVSGTVEETYNLDTYYAKKDKGSGGVKFYAPVNENSTPNLSGGDPNPSTTSSTNTSATPSGNDDKASGVLKQATDEYKQSTALFDQASKTTDPEMKGDLMSAGKQHQQAGDALMKQAQAMKQADATNK